MNEPAFSGYMVEVLLHGMPLLDSSGDGFGLPSMKKKSLTVLIFTLFLTT